MSGSLAARVATSPTIGSIASGSSASSARSSAPAISTSPGGSMRPLDQPVRRRPLDGGAVAGVLDDPHRPLGPPREPPGLPEGAGAAAPLLDRAPRHAERHELVEQVRPASPFGVRRSSSMVWSSASGRRRAAFWRRRGRGRAAPGVHRRARCRWRGRRRAVDGRAASRPSRCRRRRAPRRARRADVRASWRGCRPCGWRRSGGRATPACRRHAARVRRRRRTG
jgi:hypothetical protein